MPLGALVAPGAFVSPAFFPFNPRRVVSGAVVVLGDLGDLLASGVFVPLGALVAPGALVSPAFFPFLV